jgi:hypothetical protein
MGLAPRKLRTLIARVVEFLGLVQVVKWIIKLLGWGEHVEFIANRLRDLGDPGIVIAFLLDPPPALGLAIVIVGLSLIWWDVRRNRINGGHITVASKVSSSQNNRPACDFLFGSKEPFEVIKRQGDYIAREVWFGIRNSGGGYLTNCHIFVTKISPGMELMIPWRLTVDSLSLREDEPPKYIKLASYLETGRGNQSGDRIVFSVVPSEDNMENVRILRPGDYLLTLCAESTDIPNKEAHCRISIGAKDRLRLRAYS